MSTNSRAPVAHVNDFALPWEKAGDAQSFKKWLSSSLSLVLVVGLVMPWLVLPEVEREELEELPPQLARIVLEKPKPKVPPPPPQKKEEPKPEEKPKEEPKPKEEKVAKAEPKVSDAKEKAA